MGSSSPSSLEGTNKRWVSLKRCLIKYLKGKFFNKHIYKHNMVEPHGSSGDKSGDIFHISLLEACIISSLSVIFRLDILDGQKVTICFLGVAALESLWH